jgi:hypothetical protein
VAKASAPFAEEFSTEISSVDLEHCENLEALDKSPTFRANHDKWPLGEPIPTRKSNLLEDVLETLGAAPEFDR